MENGRYLRNVAGNLIDRVIYKIEPTVSKQVWSYGPGRVVEQVTHSWSYERRAIFETETWTRGLETFDKIPMEGQDSLIEIAQHVAHIHGG
ncbi:MAG: hypothetical protein E6J41_01495 [Chloroflexi bacterium]|nr:MAG: hypothetical protein E6J41_01495 [Chloroflexota bacterium]